MTETEIARLAAEGAEECLPAQLAYLERLTSVDCASGNREGNRRIVEIIEEELHTLDGIEIERYELPKSGIDLAARIRPAHPEGKMILNAHTDTVFQSVSCTEHPFRIEDGRAYGLGIGDCKSGIVIAIEAVRIMQRAGLLPNWEIVFLFNCDEEWNDPDGTAFFDRELPADRAFVFECARNGSDVITARRSRCSFLLDVTGVRAHSGNGYTDGRSAAVELAHRILRVYESNDAAHGLYFNIGALKNFDPANVVSGHCTAQVDTRPGSRQDLARAEEILARVAAEPPYLDGTVTTVRRIGEALCFYEREERNVRLYEELRAAGQSLGQTVGECCAGGYGDVCYLSAKGCDAVDGLGAAMENMHAQDEFIDIRSMTERTALFAAYLGRMK